MAAKDQNDKIHHLKMKKLMKLTNFQSCLFGQTKINYLGHLITIIIPQNLLNFINLQFEFIMHDRYLRQFKDLVYKEDVNNFPLKYCQLHHQYFIINCQSNFHERYFYHPLIGYIDKFI
jgi:hypothetical protein